MKMLCEGSPGTFQCEGFARPGQEGFRLGLWLCVEQWMKIPTQPCPTADLKGAVRETGSQSQKDAFFMTEVTIVC